MNKIIILIIALLLLGCAKRTEVRISGANILLRHSGAQELLSPDGHFLAFFRVRIDEGDTPQQHHILHITGLSSDYVGIYYSSEEDRNLPEESLRKSDIYWDQKGRLIIVGEDSEHIGVLEYSPEEKIFRWIGRGGPGR